MIKWVVSIGGDDARRCADRPMVELNRRKVLGSIGSLAIAGSGVAALSGSGAAQLTVDIGASDPGTVSNDRGDLSKVSVDPQFSVQWEGLDEAVAKVFYLIEARVDGGEWMPIFRATPWLPAGTESNSFVTAESGTTGEYTLKTNHSAVLNSDSRFDNASESAGPLVVADDNGAPAYGSVDWSNYGPSDYERYVNTGTSMGSATEAEQFLVTDNGLVLQNNYPAVNAGYYGAASDTTPFDNTGDNSTATTTVELRYTFELKRPNRSWAVSRTGLDSSATNEELAENLPGINASDIDSGNSKIVMDGTDGYADFSDPDGVPYDTLQQKAGNHPGIAVATAGFGVSVANELSESGVSGSSNANAE